MFDNQNNVEEGTMSWEALMGEDPLEVEQETEETTETVEEEKEEEVQTTSEEETETEEETTETEEKEKPKPSSSDNTYSKLAKKYLEQGRWSDAIIETEDGEVKLSELEDIDEETFDAIQEQQEKDRKEEELQQYISKEGLNDTTLKIIELQKSGGDITEALQVYKDYVHPYEGLDLDDEKVQEAIVRDQLTRQGIEADIIDTTIDKYKKDLILDKKAETAVDFVNKAFDKFVEDRKQRASEETKKKEAEHKEYLKNLKDTYNELDLKPALKNKFLKAVSERNENGDYQAVDVFKEQLKDPKKAKELLYFLLEPEAYKKSIGAKAKIDNNVDTLKKIRVMKDKDRKQTTDTKKKEEDEQTFEFFEIDS